MRGVPAKGADGGVPRGLELNSRFGASVVRGVFFGSGSEYGPEPRVVVDDLEEALGVRASSVIGVFFLGVLDKA